MENCTRPGASLTVEFKSHGARNTPRTGGESAEAMALSTPCAVDHPDVTNVASPQERTFDTARTTSTTMSRALAPLTKPAVIACDRAESSVTTTADVTRSAARKRAKAEPNWRA